jgi:hypothetical protein
MIVTSLIDIDNLKLSIIGTFVVIDDKGREIVHKDSEKMIKGENFDIGGEI